MLSSHVYWNLDGFQNPTDPTINNYSLHLPYSGQRIAVDGILIPNGTILPNEKGSGWDFWSAPKKIGVETTSPDFVGGCGTGCVGIDTCFLVNRAQNGPYDWRNEGPVATVASPFSGIQIDVFSDQDAFQIYSCPGQNCNSSIFVSCLCVLTMSLATTTIKETQGFFNQTNHPRVVEKYGCMVMEVEDWIDAINQPSWQREKKNIFGPGDDPYVLQATYKFSLNKDLAATYNSTSSY